MFNALFEEIHCMKDAWGMSPREALIFIAENRDMYEGDVGAEFDRFLAIMEEVYGLETGEVLVH